MDEQNRIDHWISMNRACLAREVARLKRRLGAEDIGTDAASLEASDVDDRVPPAAIDQISALFGLSSFERDVLLLCAGVEMDSRFATICASANGKPQQTHATFGLALSILDEPHWSALTPVRPLRRFHLVELGTGSGLTSAPLRIDERILHFLAGINLIDPRLQNIIRANDYPEWIADEHANIAIHASRLLSDAGGDAPVLQLCGDDSQGQEDVGAVAAQRVGLRLFTFKVDDLPASGLNCDQLTALWERESRLLQGLLLVQTAPSGLSPAVRFLIERLPGPLIVASRDPIRLERKFVRLDVEKPRPAGQKRLWERVLRESAANLNGTLDYLSDHFRLSAQTILALRSFASDEDGKVDSNELWKACRSHCRPRLDDLAERIMPAAEWDDLVLAVPEKQTLRQLCAQARHRMQVYEAWGFASNGRRGLGLSALFTGESGTGKTLAAEVLANDLGLDLYRIDLASVVSKYIGETEKNLKRVFDAAEEGGALLLFDEADALFGKRGDVKDSHDRYANIEVSYLLQRMEAYQGVAILTTNLKSSMDRSFQRRLRFTVNFPFPDAEHRETIWSRIFPAKTPTEGLIPRRLAQLNMAGGNIRNIAVNAAFLAAESKCPVGMEQVLSAAKLEAEKIERPLTDAEIRGWV
jgi:hypothetical protein